jgi:hypothetical protein
LHQMQNARFEFLSTQFSFVTPSAKGTSAKESEARIRRHGNTCHGRLVTGPLFSADVGAVFLSLALVLDG